MKPVNLLPGDAPVVVAAGSGKPNMGAIGAMAAGLIALIVIAGVFAMGRVDSVKSETTAANDGAAKATADTAAVRSQIESLGQPVVDNDKQLAQGAETVLVAAYGERHDFVQLARELRAIMEGTGGWYESVEATTSAVEGKAVTITGYARTKELAASFNERANATRSLADAETVGIESERLTDLDTKRPGVYFKFTMTADLVDTVAPSVGGASTAGGGVDGTTVADGGGAGDENLTLSLDATPTAPKPKPAKAKSKPEATTEPKAPAAPKNPFDVASDVATGGTS